jgi:hypothetical protein
MSKELEQWRAGAVSRDARKIDAALERLGVGEIQTGLPRGNCGARKTGRLVVALDLTGSREWGLKAARKATAAMFQAIAALGSVAVKLVYFRGREIKAGLWQEDAEAVCRSMLTLSTAWGNTKIGRVLELVADEPGPVSAMVYVGDHSEEDGNELVKLAQRLGAKRIPVFVFQEISDDDDRWIKAKPVFEAIASASGGHYCPFNSGAADALQEMLSTVAAFSAAGSEGLKQVVQPLTVEARRLQGRLLMLPAASSAGSDVARRK